VQGFISIKTLTDLSHMRHAGTLLVRAVTGCLQAVADMRVAW